MATFRRNMSQHCWPHHVACVSSPCCDVLRHVECWESNKCACLGATLVHEPGQTTTTSCNIHKCWPFSNLSQQHPTCRNMSQHVATGWPNARNLLSPTMLRYVALKGCYRLVGALCCSLLSRFVQQCCTWACALQSNLYITVTLGKWPGDRYIQGDRCTQIKHDEKRPIKCP